ncbi:MAG: biopolymer transporter ExbD [Proteobacteria bacterium]|jgi:biopolymer transport protein TolR|nr:biopolymer transporter ExbD [Pseudomonadota bacterium]
MAFSLQNNHKNLKKKPAMAEINITPFVDVLLVLLIIFMVAAPMLTSSVPLNLPDGVENQTTAQPENIIVSMQQNGVLFVQEEAVNKNNLANKLKKLTNNNLSEKILVRADKLIEYGEVMNLIKMLSMAGFSQVLLVTEVQ